MKKIFYLAIAGFAVASCGDGTSDQSKSSAMDTSSNSTSKMAPVAGDTAAKAADSSSGVPASNSSVGATDGSNNSGAVGGSINSSGNKTISGTGGGTTTDSSHNKGSKKNP